MLAWQDRFTAANDNLASACQELYEMIDGCERGDTQAWEKLDKLRLRMLWKSKK